MRQFLLGGFFTLVDPRVLMNVLRGNDKALACQAPFTLALVCLVQEDRVLLDSRLQIAFYLYHPTENIDIWQGFIF